MASVSDGPDETSNEEKVSKEEVEGNCNGESDSKESGSSNSSSTTKPPVLKAPTFGSTFSFLGSTSSPSDGISDSSSPMQGKPFTLNPPKLSNPFLKVEKNDDAKEEDAKSKETSTPSQPNSQAEKTGNSSNKSSLSFVPLGGDSSSSKQNQSSMFAAPSSSTPALGFVFGQNIREKVEAAPAPPTPAPQEPEAGPSPPQETSEVTANGTSSEMLFSVQVPSTENSDKNNDAGKSLSEAAREYEEARAVKRKFEEVPVLTGEEEEANVIQINCKLFSFSNCTWLERGRGTLRVNDLPTSPGTHRLIVRTAGNFRVVLNTKIWPEMIVERASTKSLRITAMDSNGVVKIFVVMASPKEIDQLQKCLEWRINNLKKNEESPPKKVCPTES